MDSPRTERSQTRFSTPVSDLDDHRNQPDLPRAIAFGREGAEHHATTHTQHERPHDPIQLAIPNQEHSASVSRDFENAIIEDAVNVETETEAQTIGFTSPTGPRRGASRRAQTHTPRVERSRESSESSRSISPPNSVDAFAEPRRRERAGTFGSHAPSDLSVNLKRTGSRETHRRPTFSSGRSIRVAEADNVNHAPTEDVCFPHAQDPSKTFTIDFEELEEFVAECNRGRPHIAQGCRQKLSFSSQGAKPKFPVGMTPVIPHITTESASCERRGPESSESAIDDTNSIMAEKEGHPLATKDSAERRPSVTEASRFSFFSSEIEQTIHAPELGDLVMPGEGFRDLFSLPVEGGVWWLDVMNPTQDELLTFMKAFHIHKLTAEDIQAQEPREKVELFKQYYFVCFRSFYQMDVTSEDYLEPVNVYMVVFREGIITFTHTPSPHAANVRKRIGTLRDYVFLTADWICYALIDNIVDNFGPVIHCIEAETDQIEDQVFVARSDDFSILLKQIGGARKKVNSLMRLLGGKADVIKGFAKRCNEQYSVTPRGEIGLYLGDIQDHVVTMMSNLGHFEKMLSRSHSNYLAQLSVDNIAQGNHANKVLSKITLIATVLVPLNLITGLFGMNVDVPGRSSAGLHWFFGIIGVILAIVVGSLVAARRYRFI
ncbi:Mg(2+) transporter [Bachmanniomyces sp. S44760]|nr:Mg(2+) transporter [Bachmanniomyces sp. S44760]